MKSKVRVTKSSGNVFADIGVPSADEHFVKAEIVLDITACIKAKGLTQAGAAKLMGLSQPDVSKLLRGNFAGYTLDRLFSFLRALGNDMRIQIVPTRRKTKGQVDLVSNCSTRRSK
ncbi:MAG: helix-turn-helix transcriptional regulator [Xanthobacteraceae bacterium]